MREVDLYPPVKQWLESHGLEVHPEVQGPLRGGAHDIVAVRAGKSLPVIVELKLSFSRDLAYQCSSAMYASPLTYAAAPGKPSDQFVRWAEKAGFGIVSVGDTVEILKKPHIHYRFNHRRARGLRQRVRARGDEDRYEVGGRPTMKGIGPAQEVSRRVAAYRALHPEATWPELFERVPNHYYNYKSMRGALKSRGLA